MYKEHSFCKITIIVTRLEEKLGEKKSWTVWIYGLYPLLWGNLVLFSSIFAPRIQVNSRVLKSFLKVNVNATDFEERVKEKGQLVDRCLFGAFDQGRQNDQVKAETRLYNSDEWWAADYDERGRCSSSPALHLCLPCGRWLRGLDSRTVSCCCHCCVLVPPP